jgi:2-keto-3-deoxy-L-rhamnonate aldolase RhmA
MRTGKYPLKEALKGRKTTIGSWITLVLKAIAEIMAGAGFEWLVVDLEHRSITLASGGVDTGD